MKAQIADNDGYYLGKFLGDFDSSSDISLIGFSFGARVVGSALQTLASSPSAYMSADRTGRVSLVLASAGCDEGSFDYGRYAQGAKIPQYVLNIYNPSDFALHYYPFVADAFGAKAQGTTPLIGVGFANAYGRTYNLNIRPCVGREHSFTDEINCTPVNVLVDALF